MSRNKRLREDPAVKQTTATLGLILSIANLPAVPEGMTDLMERTDCLDGDAYALMLMCHHGENRVFSIEARQRDFPRPVFEAWKIISHGFSTENPSAYIFDAESLLAKKFALLMFVKDVKEGRIEALASAENEPGGGILDRLAEQLIVMHEKAIAGKVWRELPQPLIHAYIEALNCVERVLQGRAVQAPVKESIACIHRAVAEDIRQNTPAKIDPDSLYAKMKGKAQDRFKL